MTRRCDYCGDPFSPRAYNQKFCGSICGRLSRGRVSTEDVCGNCRHPRASHFASRGRCDVFVRGVQCDCWHFRFKRDD